MSRRRLQNRGGNHSIFPQQIYSHDLQLGALQRRRIRLRSHSSWDSFSLATSEHIGVIDYPVQTCQNWEPALRRVHKSRWFHRNLGHVSLPSQYGSFQVLRERLRCAGRRYRRDGPQFDKNSTWHLYLTRLGVRYWWYLGHATRCHSLLPVGFLDS